MLCPDGREITLIEYRHDRRGVLVPFSVCSRGLGYDFEWSDYMGTCYYHMSAAGYRIGYGKTYLGTFVKKRPRHPIWLGPGIIPCNRNRPIRSRKTLARMGYQVVRQPLELESDWGGSTLNPFEFGQEGAPEFCRICDDWFPDFHECDHIWWCDECGMMSGEGSWDACSCERDLQVVD